MKQRRRVGQSDPGGIEDARTRVLSSIVRRRGQPLFRKRLLKAYDRRCAFTGCAVEALLEAAHIVPYRGSDTNHIANGLLLRADLHTLFEKLSSLSLESFRGLFEDSLYVQSYVSSVLIAAVATLLGFSTLRTGAR